MEISKNYVDRLRRKNKILTMLLTTTLLTFGALLFLIKNDKGSEKFISDIDEVTALKNIKAVRSWPLSTKKSSKGVWYDTAEIRRYLDIIYPDIIKHLMAGHTKPPKYDWKVGFYWMKTKDRLDTTKTKRDFCVIPILVDTTKKGKKADVIDYFEDAGKDEAERVYNHDPRKSMHGGRGSAYDNGQMWP